jgi:hypothetical protein
MRPGDLRLGGHGGPARRASIFVFALLALFALVMRIWAATERVATSTLVGMVDSQIYMQLARSLPAHGWIPEQGFYMSPLYAYLLAVLRVDAGNPWPILIAQSLVAVAGLIALALVAQRCAGQLAGWATLCLGALSAPVAVYDVSILSDGPSFALMAMGLSLLVLRGDSWRSLLGAGCCFALGYALRANFLLPAFLCGIWLLAARRRIAWVYALPLVAALLAVAAVNHAAEGQFTPRSYNAGQNLYIGNNAAADGSYTTLNEIHPGDMMGRAAAERACGHRLSASEVEDFWRQQTLQFVTKQPGSAAILLLRKFALFFHPHEMPQMEALDLVRRESLALRISMVGVAMLLPLAAAGAIGLGPGRHRALLPFWISLGSTLLICLLFFVNGRLRLPIHLTLLPLAGIGVAALLGAVAEIQPRRAVTGLIAGLVLVFLLALYPTHAPYRNALSAARYAVLEALAGQRERAREWMRVAGEFEDARGSLWSRPPLAATIGSHPEARWLLQAERAAAWFVLDDLRRAFAEMSPAADAMPRNMRAQEGLLEICGRLTESGMGGPEVDAAARRARSRLQGR